MTNNASQPEIQIKFEDWIPGVAASVSLFMVNLVDRELLMANDYSYSGSRVAWKARLWFFVGLSLGAGSLGGALSIYFVNYADNSVNGYFGVSLLVQNVLIVFGSALLWMTRNWHTDYVSL